MPSAVSEAKPGKAAAEAGQRITVRYFAWVRERLGRGEEVLDVPASVETVGELEAWLATLGPEYEALFQGKSAVRAAVDQVHVKRAHKLAGAREVAFFPPVTGG
jgi:molybdopterin synthase sulfur carrier subunit